MIQVLAMYPSSVLLLNVQPIVLWYYCHCNIVVAILGAIAPLAIVVVVQLVVLVFVAQHLARVPGRAPGTFGGRGGREGGERNILLDILQAFWCKVFLLHCQKKILAYFSAAIYGLPAAPCRIGFCFNQSRVGGGFPKTHPSGQGKGGVSLFGRIVQGVLAGVGGRHV
jgi:hypothetical protein